MKLHDLATWLHGLHDITGGCTAELLPFDCGAMRIMVKWERNGRRFGYEHNMSGGEMRRMSTAHSNAVLEQITNAVRRMVEDANEQR